MDTDHFDGIKPRNWRKPLEEFVYDNLAGTSLEVFNEDGTTETISFAKKNERVQKDGSKNNRRVIDELARYRGDNIRALSTVHIDELLETSKTFDENSENKHQWLDQNGWELKRTYVQTRNGKIAEVTLNIAKARDGRKILYALSNIKEVDNGNVPSALKQEGPARNVNFKDSIPQQGNGVKKNLFTENGGLSGIDAYRLGRALIGSENAGEVDFDGAVPGAKIAARYISTQEAMKLLEKSGVKISKVQAENLKNYHNQRAELAHSIARAFGVNVRFGGVESGALAQYERSTNTIYLNPSEKISVMKELAEGHELVHAIEQTKNYGKISDLVVEQIFGGTNSPAYIAEAQRIDSLYRRLGNNLSAEDLKAEVVAEYFRTKVFKNAETLQQFIETNYESLGQSFINTLKQTAAKVQQVFGKNSSETVPSVSQQVLDALAVSMNQARRDSNAQIQSDRLDAVAEGYGLLEHYNSAAQNQNDVKFFASDSSEAKSIKNQIRKNLETINKLNPVADITYQTGKSKKQVYDEITRKFVEIGWKVDRQNFGIIEINQKDINVGLNYLNTQAEYAAMYTVPKVLKRGEIIHKGEHKGRGHDTITIAAPVVINGTSGVLGVVVKQTKGNHYKTHRILMPDGSMFELNKNEEVTTDWMTDVPTGESQPITSSNNIVPPSPDDVKKKSLATWNSVQGLYDDAVPESSVSELYNDSVPDEALAEQARLEAAEFLEAPDTLTNEDIGRRYQHEKDLFDGALKDVDVSRLSDTEYLKSSSGSIVKAHEIFKNVRRRADNVILQLEGKRESDCLKSQQKINLLIFAGIRAKM